MKKFFTLFTLLAVAVLQAQIPAGYYNSASGTGYTLKTQLYNIINGHDDQGYGGLYTTYLTSDKDFYYENNGTLLDMYTENPSGTECEFNYGTGQDNGTGGTVECDKYNREHLIPQSVFNSATPMYSDAHFVVPSDKYVNGQRGNLPFGRVGSANYTSTNGSKRGTNLNSGYSAGYTGVVFEPIDEFKGDIARMLLYFATRYQNQVTAWDYDMFNGTANQVFTTNALNILLTWHLNDPVSQREIDRNDAIYDRQENRNPYIDHPEYACQIWTSACQALGSSDFALAEYVIYPNPTQNQEVTIYSTAQIQQIQLISAQGQLIRSIQNPVFSDGTLSLSNLPQGFYFLQISSDSGQKVEKIIVP